MTEPERGSGGEGLSPSGVPQDSTDAPPAPTVIDQPGRSPWRLGAAVFVENRLAVVSVLFLVLFALFCFVGPLLYHTDQIHTNLAEVTLRPGAAGHPLGTDDQGYDQLGRLMVGGQSSLEVGVAAAVLATLVGTVAGAFSGYFGGLTDSIMMRTVDGILAIPTMFLLLLLAAIVAPTKSTLILVIALISWLVTARLVRGEALTLRTLDYVSAAKAMGSGHARTVFRHIAPNALGVVVVNATFQVADAILALATLSFLGLGLTDPQVDLGGMLNNGIAYVYVNDWWLIWPPGVLIILIVAAFNFIGDALRDAFEVRLQKR